MYTEYMTDIHRECCSWWQSKSQFWQHPHSKAMGKFKASTAGLRRDSQASCKQHLSGTREAGLPERQRLPRAVPSVLLPRHPLPLHSRSAPRFCGAALCRRITVLRGPARRCPSSAFFCRYSAWKAAECSDSCIPPCSLVLPIAGWSNCLLNGQNAFCFPQTRFWDAYWPSVLLFRSEWGGSRGAFSLPSTLFQHSRWDFVLQQSNLISCFQPGNGG